MRNVLFLLLAVLCCMGIEGGWSFPPKNGRSVRITQVPDWGKDGFTLEVWCRPDKPGCGYAVLLRGSFGYPNFVGEKDIDLYLIDRDGNKGNCRGYTPLEFGKYHHYVLTGTAEATVLYRDGKAIRTNKCCGIPTYLPNVPMNIGHSLGWAENFVGSIDLVRLYNRALSAVEVKEHCEALQQGKPLATDASVILDEPKPAAPAVTAAPTADDLQDCGWVFPPKDKKSVVALRGIDDWGDKGFTAEVWCRPDEPGCGYAVLMQRAFGFPKFVAEKDFDGYIVNDEGKDMSGRIYLPLELKKYHHYVMSCDREKAIFYRDGKAMRINKGNAVPKYQPSAPLYIGYSAKWCDRDFAGCIGLVRIYDRPLSEAEVKDHFQKLQKKESLPKDDSVVLDEDRRFGEKKTELPPDVGQKVTRMLDNTTKDRRMYPRSRHLEGKTEKRKPLVDFENLEGWTMTYVSGDVEPVIRRSREMPQWGDHVLRFEYRQGARPKEDSKVILMPPAPIRINEEFDAVSIWRFANSYGTPRPHLWFSIQWRDPEGNLHDTGRMGGMLEVGWGLQMCPLTTPMKAGSQFVSITFSGFNEPKRVLYLDSLCFYRRSQAVLSDAKVPSYEELGVPNRKETIQPTAAEPGQVTLESVKANHWRFTSCGTKTGKVLQYDIQAATGTLSDITATYAGKTFTPMQGGGFLWATDNRYPVAKSSLISPLSNRIKATLASYSVKGQSLSLVWNYLIDGKIKRTARWELTARDNTLVIDLNSDLNENDGHVGEFQFGGISGITGKVVEIPYLTWGRWIHDSNPPGIFAGEGCFVFPMLDWYNSDASGIFGESSATPGGHFELDNSTADHRWVVDDADADPTNTVRDYSVVNGGSYYWPTTAGKRNPARERVMLTVSDKLAHVLPTIPHHPNPDMPLTRDTVWVTRMWYTPGAVPDYFEREYAMWKECHDYGMEKLNIRLHGNINRMYAPIANGDPSTFVTPFATPLIGGDEALADFFKRTQKLGYRVGIYTDHMILGAMAYDAWDEDLMNLDSNGNWIYSSGNDKQTKISRMVALQTKWNGLYARQFHPDCAYLDQITCPPCWRYTDYDARTPDAGKFSAAWRVFAASLRQERKDFGPVLSEGKTQLFFAGLCDSYAQPQRMYMNVIPDFNLLKIHPLSNDCGAELGWINYKGAKGGEMNRWSYKGLAYEYAYGSIGHLASCYHGAPLTPVPGAMIRSYFLIQPMQKYFAGVKIREVLYCVKGEFKPFEEALGQGTLSQNQVKLVYENGFQVAVNLNEKENLKVTLNGIKFLLPPEGFAAVTANGKSMAFSAQEDGRRVDMCIDGSFLYSDNAPAMSLIQAKGAYLLRGIGTKQLELIPAPFKQAEKIILPAAVSATLVKLDRDGNVLGRETLKAARGIVSFTTEKSVFKYRLTVQ